MNADGLPHATCSLPPTTFFHPHSLCLPPRPVPTGLPWPVPSRTTAPPGPMLDLPHGLDMPLVPTLPVLGLPTHSAPCRTELYAYVRLLIPGPSTSFTTPAFVLPSPPSAFFYQPSRVPTLWDARTTTTTRFPTTCYLPIVLIKRLALHTPPPPPPHSAVHHADVWVTVGLEHLRYRRPSTTPFILVPRFPDIATHGTMDFYRTQDVASSGCSSCRKGYPLV